MMDILKNQNIHTNYIFDKLIADGYYSEVYKAYHRLQDLVVAIKKIDKNKIDSNNLQNIQNQCDILLKLEHPNIIRIYEVYDYQQNFYIVMEYIEGGDICEWVNQLSTRDQMAICSLIKTITDALKYCHSNSIVHRDLRPENILISNLDGNEILKIVDFGMSKIVGQSLLTTACGNPLFFAPEIIQQKPYDYSVDYWSLGVLIYILLCGKPPFRGYNDQQIQKRILSGKLEFPEEDWKYISSSAKDLIIHLLQVDPKKRFRSEKIQNHPWIVSGGAQLQHPDLSSNLLKYTAQRKLQKAQNLVKIALSYSNETLNNSKLSNQSSVMSNKKKY